MSMSPSLTRCAVMRAWNNKFTQPWWQCDDDRFPRIGGRSKNLCRNIKSGATVFSQALQPPPQQPHRQLMMLEMSYVIRNKNITNRGGQLTLHPPPPRKKSTTENTKNPLRKGLNAIHLRMWDELKCVTFLLLLFLPTSSIWRLIISVE